MKYRQFLLPFWLGLWLYALYLLSFSGKLHVMDELAVFTAGHNLGQHGRADINPLIWTNHWTPNPPGLWGQDHQLYTKKAPGISLFIALFTWLKPLSLNFIHLILLTNAVSTAYTAALLLVWLQDLGFSRRAAWLTALGYGSCTLAWVYARMLWELSILAACFLTLAWLIYRLERGDYQQIGWFGLTGFLASLSLTLRFEAALAIGFMGLYLAWQLRHTNRVTWWQRALAYGLPILITLITLAYFNSLRYGAVNQTGYNQEIHFNAPWWGGFGLLFSPGNGLFLFSPFMLLLFGGIWPAWQRLPRPYLALLSTIFTLYWLFYGSWFAWGGIWDWGPRFLLPTLPFLMVFVAATLDRWHWPTLVIAAPLALMSFIINLLGVMVDFNEHFRRIEHGETFRFNWATYPPLGHWYILQEGLTDLAWLAPLNLAILTPALLLLALATGGLIVTLRHEPPNPIALKRQALAALGVGLAAWGLTYLMLWATTQADLAKPQAQADRPLLTTLTQHYHPHDALLMALPPFADAQEITTYFMAYLTPPLPLYAWIESDPRAILPPEREHLWQAITPYERVWLFERWLTPADPLGATARQLNEQAFPLSEQWFDHSGKLTLYSLTTQSPQISQTLSVPFQGGLTLDHFEVIKPQLKAGEVLQLRLTWQISPEQVTPNYQIVSYVHVISGNTNLAQQDRLLPDLAGGSPTLTQGYGLTLPADTATGSYPVIIGLYLPASGQPLPRADTPPDDFLYLLNIHIK